MRKIFLRCLYIALLIFSDTLLWSNPWWNTEWKYRARIEVETPRLNAAIDAASLVLFTGGKTRPDAGDLKIFDSRGKETPYKVISAAPGTVEILLYVDGSENFYAYFGNAGAEKPFYSWEPATGELTLETRQRTDRRHPATLEEMITGFNSSSIACGKGPRKKIDASENPFGPNDYYYSYYRGHINCPVEGRYWFSTNSDDASFLLIDGEPVIGWPLSHTKDGRTNLPLINEWTRRKEVFLQRGIHLIEYYHEEGVGSQLARAGWKKPGDEEFSVIPEETFVKTLKAKQVSLEEHGKSFSIFFNRRSVRNVQFVGAEKVFVTVKFFSHSLSPDIEKLSYRWDFDNGLSSVEKNPECIFAAGKVYNVSLAVSDTKGNLAKIRIPVPVNPEGEMEKFRIKMGASGDRMIYDEKEPARMNLWVKNYTEKPCRMNLSKIFLDRESNIKSRTTELLAVDKYKTWNIAFPVPPEIYGARFSLKYGSYVVEEISVKFLEPGAVFPPLMLSDGNIMIKKGEQALFRFKKPPDISNPAFVTEKKKEPFRIVVIGNYLPEKAEGATYLEGFIEMAKANTPMEVFFLRTNTNLPQYSPLAAIARMNEAMKYNPDLILFNPELTGIANLLDIEKFKLSLSFFIVNCCRNNISCAVVVPPPFPGEREKCRELAIAIKETGIEYSAFLIDLYSLLSQDRIEDVSLSGGKEQRVLARSLLNSILAIKSGNPDGR